MEVREHIHAVNRTCLQAIRAHKEMGNSDIHKRYFGMDDKTANHLTTLSDQVIDRLSSQCVLLLSLSEKDLKTVIDKALSINATFPQTRDDHITQYTISFYLTSLHESCSTNARQACLRFGVSYEFTQEFPKIPLDKILCAVSLLNFSFSPRKGASCHILGEGNSVSRARRILSSIK
jgi:hypothetical protein